MKCNILIIITLFLLAVPSLQALEQCYDRVGCFNTGGPFFDPLLRLINLVPEHPDKINTQFILFTRKNPTEGQFLKSYNDSTVTSSNFDSSKEIKMIIHGFTDSGMKPWIKDMTARLLERGDFNVISVDWAGGAILTLYTQSTANTRLVAAETILLIEQLQRLYEVQPENIHIIGHSLGAHTAGYIGQKIKNIGRISGMDPAEPYFQGLDIAVRLDPSDAKFVDTIHSDSKTIFLLGFGMIDPVGHVDFYPNGGSEQPGCERTSGSLFADGLSGGFINLVACNHMRSYKFFTESINNKDLFYSTECSNYRAFLNGECNCGNNNENCTTMGYDAAPKANQELVKYYLKTGAAPPYVIYHYQLIVTLGNGEGSVKQNANIFLELYGNGKTKFQKTRVNNEAVVMNPNSVVTSLFTQTSKLEDLSELSFSWQRTSSLLDPSSWFQSKKAKIYIENVIINPIGFQESMKFCADMVGISQGDTFKMKIC